MGSSACIPTWPARSRACCSKSTTRSCSTCSNTTRPSRLRWTRLWPSFRPIKLSSRLLRLLPSPHRFNPRKTEVRRRSLYQLEKKKRNKKTSKTKASTQKNCKNGKQKKKSTLGSRAKKDKKLRMKAKPLPDFH